MIYVYRCPTCAYECEITHGMTENIYSECPECGEPLRRKPQPFRINWGGLPPSKGEMHPAMRRLIDDAPRRIDEQVPHKSDRLARLEKELGD